MGGKPTAKIRTKAPAIRTSPAPKADAANQTQIKPYANLQPHHLVSTNKWVDILACEVEISFVSFK